MSVDFDSPPSRRERVRAQTLSEIDHHGLALVDTEGAEAVTIAAIAKTMGMTAPALYRYVASRDALLSRLVTVAYAGLADTLEQAAAGTSAAPALQRLRAVAASYRQWSLAHPHRYTMMFARRPAGVRDTPEAIATINRGMYVLLAAITELAGPAGTSDAALDAQLTRWSQSRELPAAGGHAMRLAVLTWTRLHGIVGLEIVGAFGDMQLDGRLLLEAEIDAIVRAAARPPSTRP